MRDFNLPVLLIPGLACTADLFRAQVAVLSQERDVMVADTGGQDSMEGLARDILAAAAPRFALAGLSMGGYLSFEILRQAPQRVARLALLDTAAHADTPEKTETREAAIALMESGRYEEVCEATLDLSIAKSRHQDSALKDRIRGGCWPISTDQLWWSSVTKTR